MAEVVQSLFGVTPQSYQRAQQQKRGRYDVEDFQRSEVFHREVFLEGRV